MYRYCVASLCNGNCCDYYAYCSYPNIAGYCYSSITYYYYDFWWVYLVSSILFIIFAVITGCIVRRRRRRRAMQQQDTLIINEGASPSFNMGQPVYNEMTNQGPYNNNGGYGNGGYGNGGYGNGGYSNGGYSNGDNNNNLQRGYNEEGNQNYLAGNAQNNLGYGLADNLVGNPEGNNPNPVGYTNQ